MRMICLNFLFFFSSRRRHTRSKRDWSSDVCSSDLAAYINFITSPQAMDVSVETGNLPVLASSKQPSVALMREVATAWGELSKNDGTTPYLDYATPTFTDAFGGPLQELIAGKKSAEEAMKAAQDDYTAFQNKK